MGIPRLARLAEGIPRPVVLTAGSFEREPRKRAQGPSGNLGARRGNLGVRQGIGRGAPLIESVRDRNADERIAPRGVIRSPEIPNGARGDFRMEPAASSGWSAVRTRHQLKPKWVAYGAFFGCALFAGVAMASEGGLVLLPDWAGKLPILIVLFALLIAPVNAILFKPIFQVLDAREERTNGTRERAEKIMQNAEETLAGYERAVREARAESEQARKREAATARDENAAVVDAARAESERQLEGARAELAAALEQSRRTLAGDARSLADEAASRVLGRAL